MGLCETEWGHCHTCSLRDRRNCVHRNDLSLELCDHHQPLYSAKADPPCPECERLREQVAATRKKSGRRKRELKRLNEAVRDRHIWQCAAMKLQQKVWDYERVIEASDATEPRKETVATGQEAE